MKKILLASLLATLCLVTVMAAGSAEKSDTMMKSDDAMMKTDDTMMKSDDTMMKSDDSMMSENLLMDEKGFYSTQKLQPRVVPFTTEADAQALAAKGRAVYYFAATWCPTCQATYKDLQVHVGNIPHDVTIVLVNYDTNGKLKTKYGITAQHTFIQIGPMGEKKAAWVGSTTVDAILKHLVK